MVQKVAYSPRMLVDSKSTEVTLVIPPAFLAASIDASPVATRPRIELAHIRPVLVPAWLLVALTGPLTFVYRPPSSGEAAYAHPLRASTPVKERARMRRMVFLLSLMAWTCDCEG